MEHKTITAVGIDVSKGKSTVAVRRPGGEVVLTPFQVEHNAAGLTGLVKTLWGVSGDIRVVMGHTGMYWRPIALALREAGFFVSVVNAMLIHDFSDNSLRKVKTDKADSMKIANYALSFWAELRDYSPEDETRQMLKMQCRLYQRTKKSSVVLRNGLISLLDQTFPGINALFDIQPKRSNGHFKWVDFVRRFWHKDCVASMSLTAQSGSFDAKSRRISKRGSPHLCRTPLSDRQHHPPALRSCNPVFQFMDKKHAEGKHFYVYAVAGAAKFLRIYYARVKSHLEALDTAPTSAA